MRAVVFDAMGVLYTVGDDLADLLVPFAHEHGSPLQREEIAGLYRRALVGEVTAAALWAKLGMRGDGARLEAEYLRRYELTQGMRALLTELRGRGLLLGCISN